MHTHLTPKTTQKFRCLWIFSCSLHYLGSLSEIFIGLNQMSPPKRVLNISSSSEIHYRPCLGNMYACQVGLLAEGLNGHQWHLITGERRYEQLRSQTYISFYYKFIQLYSLHYHSIYYGISFPYFLYYAKSIKHQSIVNSIYLFDAFNLQFREVHFFFF